MCNSAITVVCLCSIYEKIGKGKHSTVYKGRKKKTIQYHAIKSVDKSQKPRVLQEVRTSWDDVLGYSQLDNMFCVCVCCHSLPHSAVLHPCRMIDSNVHVCDCRFGPCMPWTTRTSSSSMPGEKEGTLSSRLADTFDGRSGRPSSCKLHMQHMVLDISAMQQSWRSRMAVSLEWAASNSKAHPSTALQRGFHPEAAASQRGMGKQQRMLTQLVVRSAADRHCIAGTRPPTTCG